MNKENQNLEYTIQFSNTLKQLVSCIQNLCSDCHDTYKICDLVVTACSKVPSDLIEEISPVLVQKENVEFITKGVDDSQINLLSNMLSSSKKLSEYGNPDIISRTLKEKYAKLSKKEKSYIYKKLNQMLNISAKYIRNNL